MTAIATPRHRVSVATAHVHAELDAVSDASVWSMDSAETAATLTELGRAKARIAELEARVAAHADDLHVGQEDGASSAANWLAHTTRQTRPAAQRTVKLGHDLDTHSPTRAALAAGEVCVDQARAIIRWVSELPDDLDADLVAKAEVHLLEQAKHYDAKTLGTLGRRLFEVIAPDEADAREAAVLEREEAAAAQKVAWRAYDDGHGTFHLHVTGSSYDGAQLTKMVLANAATQHRAAIDGAGFERKPSPQRMGEAFWELMARYPSDRLPQTGGLSATVVVTLSYESLIGQVEQAGVLDTGQKISPRLARRLTCEAGVIPAVLDGKSQLLDLGRKRRFFTEAQRIALTLRDRGCTAEGCDRTTGLHAHHDVRWTDAGPTDLTNGRLLCGWHHSKAHDPAYETTYRPDGKVAFHRRT